MGINVLSEVVSSYKWTQVLLGRSTPEQLNKAGRCSSEVKRKSLELGVKKKIVSPACTLRFQNIAQMHTYLSFFGQYNVPKAQFYSFHSFSVLEAVIEKVAARFQLLL